MYSRINTLKQNFVHLLFFQKNSEFFLKRSKNDLFRAIKIVPIKKRKLIVSDYSTNTDNE